MNADVLISNKYSQDLDEYRLRLLLLFLFLYRKRIPILRLKLCSSAGRVVSKRSSIVCLRLRGEKEYPQFFQPFNGRSSLAVQWGAGRCCKKQVTYSSGRQSSYASVFKYTPSSWKQKINCAIKFYSSEWCIGVDLNKLHRQTAIRDWLDLITELIYLRINKKIK